MVMNSSSKHYNSLDHEGEDVECVIETTKYRRVQSAPNVLGLEQIRMENGEWRYNQ